MSALHQKTAEFFKSQAALKASGEELLKGKGGDRLAELHQAQAHFSRADHVAVAVLTKYSVVFHGEGAEAVAKALSLPVETKDGKPYLSLDSRDWSVFLQKLEDLGVKVAVTS